MWDAASGGNQLQSVSISAPTGTPNNRIATVNGVGYNYDASGNCWWDGANSYTYDAQGRIASVSGGTSYNYDSSNRRVKKVAAGATTHYVWEGSQVIAEYNGSTGAINDMWRFLLMGLQQKGNSNCIKNAVANSKGLARPFGNVAKDGRIGHDGVHVVADPGSVVKTLPALAGTVLKVGVQDVGPNALRYVDVLLNNGNVAIYKDLAKVNVKPNQKVGAGSVIGTTGGKETFSGEQVGGLHFTLLKGGTKEQRYYRSLTSGDERDKIKAGMFIDPPGPNSPVNCPGESVNEAGVTPYK